MKSFANETFYVDSLAMWNHQMVLNQQKIGKLMDFYMKMKHANNMDTLVLRDKSLSSWCPEYPIFRIFQTHETERRNENPAFFESLRLKRHSPQVRHSAHAPQPSVNFIHFCRNVTGFEEWNNIKNSKEMISQFQSMLQKMPLIFASTTSPFPNFCSTSMCLDMSSTKLIVVMPKNPEFPQEISLISPV